MNDINEVTLRGHLTGAPQYKITSSNGNALILMTLATNIEVTNFKGEKENNHQEHQVEFWGKNYDHIIAWKQGQRLLVKGRLRKTSYGEIRITSSSITPT